MVVHVDKRLKRHRISVMNKFHELFWHVKTVLPHVLLQVLSSHHIDDFNELVIIVGSFKESICLEKETSQCASYSPHVKRIIVFLVFH